MHFLKIFRSQIRGQGTGIPDFYPIPENHDLHSGVGCVIPMNKGIDKCFVNGRSRDLVTGITYRRFVAGMNSTVEVCQNKIHSLINLIKYCSMEDLIGWNRFLNNYATKVETFNFSGGNKFLRFFPKRSIAALVGYAPSRRFR